MGDILEMAIEMQQNCLCMSLRPELQDVALIDWRLVVDPSWVPKGWVEQMISDTSKKSNICRTSAQRQPAKVGIGRRKPRTLEDVLFCGIP